MNIKILPVNSANAIHDQLAEKYSLRQTAIDDGRQNLPPPDALDLSVAEARILTDIKEAAAQVEKVIRERSDKASEQLTNLARGLEMPRMGLDSDRIPRAIADLYSKTAVHRHYHEYYKEFKEHEPHWNAFRAENRITSPAQYPTSRLNGFTWIAFLIFIEALANSYLFAKGSDFGLIGGVMQALIVSALNAGLLAFLMGFVVLPQINHIKPARKYMGVAGAFIVFIGVILFNLAVGHYRQQLVIGSIDPARDALGTFALNPVALADMEAWLLFMLGVAAFLLATYKFYWLDDPYPGYGKVDRKYQAVRRRVAYELERLHKDAERKLDDEIASLDRRFDDLNRHLLEYAKVIPAPTAVAANGLSDINTLNAALKTLFKEYRDMNGKVRTAAPCKYWELEIEELSRYVDAAEAFVEESRRQAGAASDRLKDCKQQVEDEQNSLSENRKKMHSDGMQEIKKGASGFQREMDNLFNEDASLGKAWELQG